VKRRGQFPIEPTLRFRCRKFTSKSSLRYHGTRCAEIRAREEPLSLASCPPHWVTGTWWRSLQLTMGSQVGPEVHTTLTGCCRAATSIVLLGMCAVLMFCSKRRPRSNSSAHLRLKLTARCPVAPLRAAMPVPAPPGWPLRSSSRVRPRFNWEKIRGRRGNESVVASHVRAVKCLTRDVQTQPI